MWEHSEISSFFNALGKYGRDFDLVSASVLSKNREQARHFYYRLVKKIKPILAKETDCTKKDDVLSAVLCFGEIWQANNLSTLSEKVNELTLDLSPDMIVSYRHMVSKALRKSLPSIDPSEKVELQLMPKQSINAEWLKQNGYNPRLIIKLKSSKPISFVTNHLATKWNIDTNISLQSVCSIELTWGKTDTITLLEIYQHLDYPQPFQLYYDWKLPKIDSIKDEETFLSSFYVQKHKLSEYEKQGPLLQHSSISLSSFADLSADGFGGGDTPHHEQQLCKQFYHHFEDSNEIFYKQTDEIDYKQKFKKSKSS